MSRNSKLLYCKSDEFIKKNPHHACLLCISNYAKNSQVQYPSEDEIIPSKKLKLI